MNDTLLQDGIELMIFGMGTVFVFLAVLVVVTTTMSALVNKFFPDQVSSAEPTPSAPQPAAANDDTLLAVISAAVHQYRSRQK